MGQVLYKKKVLISAPNEGGWVGGMVSDIKWLGSLGIFGSFNILLSIIKLIPSGRIRPWWHPPRFNVNTDFYNFDYISVHWIGCCRFATANPQLDVIKHHLSLPKETDMIITVRIAVWKN